LLYKSWLEQATDLFCPAGMDRRDPGLSPINGELAQLPRLLIQVGEDELLLNDSLRLTEKAREAGVEVQLERYPECWHVFQANTGLLKVADTALDRVATFLSMA
jgi:acetyl esterase/lipase